jgi:hypothetical protein
VSQYVHLFLKGSRRIIPFIKRKGRKEGAEVRGPQTLHFQLEGIIDIIDGEPPLDSQQIHFVLPVTKCSKALLFFTSVE